MAIKEEREWYIKEAEGNGGKIVFTKNYINFLRNLFRLIII